MAPFLKDLIGPLQLSTFSRNTVRIWAHCQSKHAAPGSVAHLQLKYKMLGLRKEKLVGVGVFVHERNIIVSVSTNRTTTQDLTDKLRYTRCSKDKVAT